MKKKSLRVYGGNGDRALMCAVYVLLALVIVIILLPVLNVIASSFSSPKAISQGKVLFWPVQPTTLGYSTVLRSPTIKSGFLNSLFYTSVGTVYNVILTVLAAYPLSRKDLYGRGFITFLFALTMFIGGGLVPSYLVVSRLGMVNTRWALIIPTTAGVWNIIVTRTFFQINVPGELLDAARIDGCDDFNFVARIVLALSKPILAVQFLLYAVGHWNSYFSAFIYIHKVELQPLQIVLRNILLLSQLSSEMTAEKMQAYVTQEEARYVSYVLKYAVIIVASVPILALYPFIQKYFIKGVLIGSIKG